MVMRTRTTTPTATAVKPGYWNHLVEYLETADHEQAYPSMSDALWADFMVYLQVVDPELVEVCTWCEPKATLLLVGEWRRHMVRYHGAEIGNRTRF